MIRLLFLVFHVTVPSDRCKGTVAYVIVQSTIIIRRENTERNREDWKWYQVSEIGVLANGDIPGAIFTAVPRNE